MPARSRPQQRLFGIPIDAVRLGEVLDMAEEVVQQRHRLLISVVNAAKIVEMRRNASLQSAVLRGNLIVADGMSVVWAAHFLNRPLPERVAGIDIMFGLLRRADSKGYRVYLFGATPSVLAATLSAIATDYPNARIVGSHHGYYTPGEETLIADQIGECRPDVLFVANVTPTKELFLARFADRMNVPVCLGVGGSFDVLGGRLKRAPATWQRWGMEWAYRLGQEPNRLWRRYLATNVLFARLVVNEYLEERRSKRA